MKSILQILTQMNGKQYNFLRYVLVYCVQQNGSNVECANKPTSIRSLNGHHSNKSFYIVISHGASLLYRKKVVLKLLSLWFQSWGVSLCDHSKSNSTLAGAGTFPLVLICTFRFFPPLQTTAKHCFPFSKCVQWSSGWYIP